ncbi:MAG TPA: phage head closure protein [Patescibacteria group bacterium]|nr:phage head closure protein [Patescibacteria group bacterium]
MTYDHELTLLGATSYTGDKIGNQIPIVEETTILCGVKSISQSEFYSAAQADLKPEVKLVIHPYEYDGQKKVRFEGITYKVLRTFEVNSEELELTCEGVGANVQQAT